MKYQNLLSLLTTAFAIAQPAPAGAASASEAAVSCCLVGYPQRNFQGTPSEQCCPWATCCGITNDVLVNRLFSAKARCSGAGGLYVYTDNVCQNDGNRRWIDSEGWSDLASAPAYHSMNLDG